VPVYRRETLAGRLPWVEVHDFETIAVGGEEGSPCLTLTRSAESEVVIVLEGELAADSSRGRVTLRRNDWLSVPSEGPLHVRGRAAVMRIAGRWTGLTALTIFEVGPDRDLELHYHDGDEYWLFFEGRGRALSEGGAYDIGPGDLIATGMGHEHGFPAASTHGIVRAVALETALHGVGRRGHLHRADHGDPVPMRALA
jgi:mannose-6-phosphate isomerase-like protein (cupin superfamily)